MGTALLGALLIAGSAFISTRTFTSKPLISGIGAFDGIFLIVTGGFYIVGIGLLKLAIGARVRTMALAVVSLIFAILTGGIAHFPISWVFRTLVAAVTDVLIPWCLSQPQIRQPFTSAAPAHGTI